MAPEGFAPHFQLGREGGNRGERLCWAAEVLHGHGELPHPRGDSVWEMLGSSLFSLGLSLSASALTTRLFSTVPGINPGNNLPQGLCVNGSNLTPNFLNYRAWFWMHFYP